MKNNFVELFYKDLEENKAYEKTIQTVINKCFEIEKLDKLNLCISITLTTPEQIRIINNEFRKIDKETDVLSFPMFEKMEIDNMIAKQRNSIPETMGDIIVSIERVKQQAEEYGHSFERELAYMVVHGFYHLMGYDHMNDEEKAVMREKEEFVLGQLRIGR